MATIKLVTGNANKW